MIRHPLTGVFALFLALALTLSPSLATADGFAFSNMDYAREKYQNALIKYKDGMEHLLLNVGVEGHEKEGVAWVVPIPAPPEEVSVKILEYIPFVLGSEITGNGRRGLLDASMLASLTQIYPILLTAAIPAFLGQRSAKMDDVSRSGSFTVHTETEAFGLTSTVVTTSSIDGFRAFLKSRSLIEQPEMSEALAPYIGKNFSLICSWLSPETAVDTDRRNHLNMGLLVSFPSNNVFYPLIPTGVYKEDAVETHIRIMGLISPELPEGLSGYSEIGHYKGRILFYGDVDTLLPFAEDSEGFMYTHIRLKAPGSALIEDISFEPRPSASAAFISSYSNLINEHIGLVATFMISLASALAAIFAGTATAPNLRTRKGRAILALYGQFNFLSLVGIFLFIDLLRPDQLPKEIQKKADWLEGEFRTWGEKEDPARRRLVIYSLTAALGILVAITLALNSYLAAIAPTLLILFIIARAVTGLTVGSDPGLHHFRLGSTPQKAAWKIMIADRFATRFSFLFLLFLAVISIILALPLL